jgi:hypothetical protein
MRSSLHSVTFRQRLVQRHAHPGVATPTCRAISAGETHLPIFTQGPNRKNPSARSNPPLGKFHLDRINRMDKIFLSWPDAGPKHAYSPRFLLMDEID